jgi:CBS domain containing-hemolysin-like protein
MGQYWVDVALIAMLMLVNGAFAGSEIALISLREGQLRALERRATRRDRTLVRLARDPNRFLGTIQLGITLAGYLASATAAVTLAQPLMSSLSFLGDAANAVAIALITFILTAVNRDVMAVRTMPDGSLVLPGTFPIHDLPDINVDISDSARDYTTIAGLVLAVLGRISTTAGDRIELANWTIEVTGTSHHAITEVRLTPHSSRRDDSGPAEHLLPATNIARCATLWTLVIGSGWGIPALGSSPCELRSRGLRLGDIESIGDRHERHRS